MFEWNELNRLKETRQIWEYKYQGWRLTREAMVACYRGALVVLCGDDVILLFT